LIPICCAKGLLLLSVSPLFWDSEDDEDPAILEIVAQERQKLRGEAFLDFGPALPTRYDVDQIELMVQSPLRVFAYWELRDATIKAALRSISIRDRHNFQLLLKWKELDATREQGLDPGTTDHWWFDTLPEHRYRLELGLYWNEYGWLPLLASDELITPRLALGPASEEETHHSQAFLEDLVRQTGIGLPEDKNPRPMDAGQPQTGDTSVVERTASTVQLPAELVSGTSRVGPSRGRPTSG
jgi:Domain of unknown function (DUF4912)